MQKPRRLQHLVEFGNIQFLHFSSAIFEWQHWPVQALLESIVKKNHPL